MKAPAKYIAAAKEAKALASACIKDARKNASQYYYTHREAEIVAIAADGERCDGESPDFIPVSELSGKVLFEACQRILESHHNVAAIAVQGGVDCYESFAEKMQAERENWDADYEPYGGGTWDANNIEVTQGERI